MVLGAFLSLFGDSTPKPALPVSDYKCSVQPTDKTRSAYQATARAQHEGEWDWEFALAARSGGKKGRRKALMDCADWMDVMDDATEMQKAAKR